MLKRELKEDAALDERLRQRPVRDTRTPSPERLQSIQSSVEDGPKRNKPLRRFIAAGGALLAAAILAMTFAFVYELPGGIADRRLSKEGGLEGAFRIPIGQTPEEAIKKFRGSLNGQVVHRERLNGGMLLFIDHSEQANTSGLQLEYVRKTWLGWKWGWGGSYGSTGAPNNIAVSYMAMPERSGTLGMPYPIIFGEILNTSVHGVRVKSAEDGGSTYKATVIHGKESARIWFALMPASASASAPYSIEVLDSDSRILVKESISHAPDDGHVLLTEQSDMDSDSWALSPLFQIQDTTSEGDSVTVSLRGIPDKLAIIDSPLIAGMPQKVLWHFWGDRAKLAGELRIVGTSKETGETVVLFEERLTEGASVRGSTTSAPSSIQLSALGFWKLDVYINEEWFDSLIVESKSSY